VRLPRLSCQERRRYPRAFFLDKDQNLEEYICFTEPDEVKITDVDIEILKLLASKYEDIIIR
jgi:hypothetical protein